VWQFVAQNDLINGHGKQDRHGYKNKDSTGKSEDANKKNNRHDRR